MGLVLPTKNPRKFITILEKISDFLKFQRYFKLSSHQKFSEKNLQKFCQQAAPKNKSEYVFDFQEKSGGLKFYEFVEDFFLDMTQPII
jgi:hypothetical protein